MAYTLSQIENEILVSIKAKIPSLLGIVSKDRYQEKIDKAANIIEVLIAHIRKLDRNIALLELDKKYSLSKQKSKVKSDSAERAFDNDVRKEWAKRVVRDMPKLTTENVLNLVRSAYIEGYKKGE
jgi:hypothetical protein